MTNRIPNNQSKNSILYEWGALTLIIALIYTLLALGSEFETREACNHTALVKELGDACK